MSESRVETVETEDKEGNPLKLDIRRPSGKNLQDSQILYSKVWGEAARGGAVLRDNVDDILRGQGVWDDAKEKHYQDVVADIRVKRAKLRKGGISLKEAKEIAFSVMRSQNELRALLEKRNDFDNKTAEAIAENTKFNYLVSVCTVYSNNGEPYFKSLDDYINRVEEKASFAAAQKLADMMFPGLNLADTTELEFLKKYKFVDEKGRPINKDGHLIDDEGRLIDEEGRYVNEKGEYEDFDHNRVDENGQPIEDAPLPFLDDSGNPIVEEKATDSDSDVEDAA
jgi:hypothetical protein